MAIPKTPIAPELPSPSSNPLFDLPALLQAASNPHSNVPLLRGALNNLYCQLEKAAPGFSEPVQGASHYAGMVFHNSKIDSIVCQQAGKIVHIVAKMVHPIDEKITLRGNLGKLAWDKDWEADNTSMNETHTTRSVPVAAPYQGRSRGS